MSSTRVEDLERALDQLVHEAHHQQLQSALDQLVHEATALTNQRDASAAPRTSSAPGRRRGVDGTTTALLLWLAAVLLTAMPVSAESGQIDGYVVARYDAQLAMPIAGIVAEIDVQVGAQVEADELLITLDDRHARRMAEIARVAAESNDGLTLAQQRLEAVQKSGKRDEVAAAEALVQQQVHLRTRARLDEELAELRLSQHRLSAPVAGVVERVLVAPGEYVEAGQPVLRLIQLDQPVVEAHIPSDLATGLKVEDAVSIIPSVAGRDSTGDITGHILYLSPVIEPEMDARFVRIGLVDPIAPKLRIGASVSIQLADGSDDVPGASPATPPDDAP